MDYIDCVIDTLPLSIAAWAILICASCAWNEYTAWNGGICIFNGRPWIRIGYRNGVRRYITEQRGEFHHSLEISTPFIDRNYKPPR